MRTERTAVLMYHRVLPEQRLAFGHPSCYHLRGTAVTPDELEAHLDWLVAQRIPVVPLADVLIACAQHRQPPAGVVLTFDDGYAEWLTEVAPRLQERQMSASFFVSTGVHAEAARAHPIDEYYFILDHACQPMVELTLPDGSSVVADLTRRQDKESLVHGPLKQWILCGSEILQSQLLTSLRNVLRGPPPDALAAALYLPRAAWAKLAQGGSQVEAHGHSHRRLTALTDAQIDQELATCLTSLKPHVGDARCFAYPDGAADARVAARVAASGLGGALGVVPGDVTATSDLFHLPRYFVTGGLPLGELLQ